MAKGDIVNDVVSVGNGGTLIYQPASGVEVIIFSLGMVNSANATVKFTDGTNHTVICEGKQSANNSGITKIGLTNTNYLRLQNDTGTTHPLGFSGIQSK
jgi:hypothetical protein|tara:strand:- start:422 stop:718 length:297 start_codon:yes stop_codon:yes gene_type:complete